MQEKLLEYLIGVLEIEETTALEQALTGDAELQTDLELLRLALAPLASLRRDVDAPEGLAVRTCLRIRENWQGRAGEDRAD